MLNRNKQERKLKGRRKEKLNIIIKLTEKKDSSRSPFRFT
jgi:hypothetical protein